jgi:hypothetical protein
MDNLNIFKISLLQFHPFNNQTQDIDIVFHSLLIYISNLIYKFTTSVCDGAQVHHRRPTRPGPTPPMAMTKPGVRQLCVFGRGGRQWRGAEVS